MHSEHPVNAFEVNCKGVYNAMVSAVAYGHKRLINTGPKEVHAGQQYLLRALSIYMYHIVNFSNSAIIQLD